jgi:D-alanyl-D-alanine carboxypeptidase
MERPAFRLIPEITSLRLRPLRRSPRRIERPLAIYERSRGMHTMPPWLTSALDYLPRWLELQVAETQLPGCALAVAHRGRLVLERAFGVADLETRAALTPKHRFRIASHSKSFTAAGIMRLVEAHTVRLDAPVGTYVTGLHDRVAATTLRQLLSHGAGVHRDGRDSGHWDLRRPFLDAAELRADLKTPPTLDADKRFKYSNHAFGLLGFVIESVAGTAYATWIRREVIERAGLSHTRPDMPVSARTPMSNGYTARMPFGRRPVGRDLATHALAPATGFVSTAGDLVRFFSQLDPRSDSKLLSVTSRRAMTRAHRDVPGVPPGRQYGLGLIRGSLGRTAWFGHSGGFPGYLTRTCVLPSLDVAFSVLTNAIDGPAQQWADGAIDILATFARHGAPKGSARRWTGRWWNTWGTCDLVPVGNRVLVARPSLTTPFYGATELTVRGDVGRISQADGFGTFGEPARLVRDKRGRATALWLGGGQFDAHADDLPKRLARSNGRA